MNLSSISEEIKPFIKRLVEINGIEPLTFPAVNAGKPPMAAMIETQGVSGGKRTRTNEKTPDKKSGVFRWWR